MGVGEEEAGWVEREPRALHVRHAFFELVRVNECRFYIHHGWQDARNDIGVEAVQDPGVGLSAAQLSHPVTGVASSAVRRNSGPMAISRPN
jgi:hypothetical protein